MKAILHSVHRDNNSNLNSCVSPFLFFIVWTILLVKHKGSLGWMREVWGGGEARELSYCVLIKNVPFHLFKLFNKLASCDGGRPSVNSAKLYLH